MLHYLLTVVVILALLPMAWRNVRETPAAIRRHPRVLWTVKVFLTVLVFAVFLSVFGPTWRFAKGIKDANGFDIGTQVVTWLSIVVSVGIWRKDRRRIILAFFLPPIMIPWGICRRFIWNPVGESKPREAHGETATATT